MVGINPLYKVITDIRTQIEGGVSLKSALTNYLQKNEDGFSLQIRAWFISLQHQADQNCLVEKFTSPYRRVFFQILESGLRGQMIHEALCQLEEEVAFACDQELELALQRLPFKLMVPLLALLFPAYLILLIGPVIQQFLEGFKL